MIDSGHAAFRTLSLPFSDESQIDQVVKFEIEAQLPQWAIEDVIVDWHKLAETEFESDLLITAVPKDDIQAALDVATGAGIEPFEVELETSAMVNAAHTAEICNLDDAQLLVHLGDYSTSVVVMDAGEVREMRVIHIGALTHEIIVPPDSGEPDAPEQDGESEEEVEVASPSEIDPIEASRRVDQAIKRIRRELGRTLSGARTVNTIEAIYVCGMELPGLVGSAVLDVPVYVLDCFEEDSGQPVDGFGQLVAAYGAAIRELGGGVMTPALRREELKYTGTWERLEFPVAVACLLLTTFLGVVFILQKRDLANLDLGGTRLWLESSCNFLLGENGHMDPPPAELKAYADQASDRGENMDLSIDPIAALNYIKYQVQQEIDQAARRLGQDSAINQPQSALVGAQLVLGVLEANHKAWRPTIWSLSAETQPAKGRDSESVVVTMTLVFHADNNTIAISNYEAFQTAVSRIPGFLEFPDRKTQGIGDGKGIEIQGVKITVNVQEFYDRLAEAASAGGENG